MALLAEGAKALGLHLSPGQLEQFELYYRELAEWNRRANLTSIAGYEETQVRHFLDSLTVCLPLRQAQDERGDTAQDEWGDAVQSERGDAAPDAGNDAVQSERRDGGQDAPLACLPGVARVVDVGSGAGFPGLPLKLAFPGLELHLIESVGKKTAFLERLTGMLGLEGVTVHTGRAEALAREPGMRDGFCLALVRGVARLSLLLEYALPFCRVGGRTLALKHGGLEGELSDAKFALSELGGRAAGVFPVTLAGLTDDRVVAAFEKVEPTPERYPRRVGIPAKRPL